MLDQAGQAPRMLKAGDPAPALNVAKWFKGTEVKAFEKGKGYVVEFWATWCMPCRASIPKLTAAQKKFGDKGMVVIGVSLDQGADAQTKVQSFVEKMGDKMGYSVMLDAGQTGAGYLGATGVQGIPHAYVVDKDGKMVWHGNPNQPSEAMELVIAEVAAGTFDVTKHAERQARFAELDGKYAAAQQGGKWAEAETLLDDIVKIRPDLAGILVGTKYGIITSAKDYSRAVAMAKKASEGELKDDTEALINLAGRVVGTPELKGADRDFATELSRRLVESTKGQASSPLAILAMALKNEGKFDEASSNMQRAIDVAQEEMEKRYYADQLNQIKQAQSAAETAKKTEPAKTEDVKPVAPSGKP
jgi:thiol-disulfide isomerase/thioredoxin